MKLDCFGQLEPFASFIHTPWIILASNYATATYSQHHFRSDWCEMTNQRCYQLVAAYLSDGAVEISEWRDRN